MHPLKQLKRILRDPSPNQGKVMQANGNAVLVATNRGSLSLTKSAGDATQYAVGDSVVLANGVIVGRRNRQSTIYVV
jgi:hypothetical protein